MHLRTALYDREPEIDAPRSPRLRCLECGRVDDSVDLFYRLCLRCEERTHGATRDAMPPRD